ncbi:hypothetical protein TG4357_01939 [Thalassovita gelatinovora]|uniref:Uncharacterized protein n=1 Tax=Thalassovita gelatinovora TaxID=53501 RepID=A0A0P1FBL3_THAGE|nr:hypothetical protein [Thalassovita gelatinovora]QIZ80116.1 hypothetical protein HFZ77_06320 [Thalassovita gelatinovora]CUH65567.1 hypothetical protein TG4357_01939 [Thalassovita gelatinovora]SER07519.1 hypothetical protein SAMN04488043_11511 [Thalassovita gelatinovora]
MIRLLCLATLMLATPALAETKQQRQDRCTIQTGIVQQAVDLRIQNKSQKRAGKLILKSDPIAGSKYEQNVDVLVDWVYHLPKNQLLPETVAYFETSCNEFVQ